MIAGVFDWVPNPIDVVTAPYRWGFDASKSAGSDVIREAFQWVAGLLLSGVSWLFAVVWTLVSEATTPDLYASWFADGPYRVMTTLAAAILMLAVMLAIAETLWNRDGAGLLRAVAQDFPKAVFILTGLLFLTTLGLAVADGVTDWLLGMFSGGATDFAEAMANVAGELQFGAGLFVVMLTAFGLMVILGLVTVMLVFREGFIFFLTAVTAVMVVLDVYRPTGCWRQIDPSAGRSDRGQAGDRPVLRAGRGDARVDRHRKAGGPARSPSRAPQRRPTRRRARRCSVRAATIWRDVRHVAGRAGDDGDGGGRSVQRAQAVPGRGGGGGRVRPAGGHGKAVVAAHTGWPSSQGAPLRPRRASAASTGAAAGATRSPRRTRRPRRRRRRRPADVCRHRGRLPARPARPG